METLSGAGQAADQSIGQTCASPLGCRKYSEEAAAIRATSHLLPSEPYDKWQVGELLAPKLCLQCAAFPNSHETWRKGVL